MAAVDANPVSPCPIRSRAVVAGSGCKRETSQPNDPKSAPTIGHTVQYDERNGVLSLFDANSTWAQGLKPYSNRLLPTLTAEQGYTPLLGWKRSDYSKFTDYNLATS